jgi:hypothetical protein
MEEPMNDRVHIGDRDERERWIAGRHGHQRLELAREAGWGEVSWLSIFAGVVTAIGTFAVCVGITAAVLQPMGIGLDGLSDSEWKSLGLGVGLGAAGVLLCAFAFGGYVAGRMARRASVRHGVLVFAIGLVVMAAAGAIAQLEDGISVIRDRVESLGAPTGDSVWSGVALVTIVAALAGMLLGSLLGSVRGERWHQRLVARALDPNVGPEADLRADLEAQHRAAAKAWERAHKAGALPPTDEPVEPVRTSGRAPDEEDEFFWRDEQPEPTAAGRPTPPSSSSSGP